MKAIYNRELKSYFTSMTAPVFIAVLTLIMGIYFMYYNMQYGYPYFSEYTLSGMIFIFTITIPILTMRSMSEERRQKTDQLLLTSPVSVGKMVMGKYLAMVTVLAIVCLIYALCPLIISTTGNAYFLVDYSCIFTFFLLGCAYVAIGMLISSLTESVILAAVGSIAALLLMSLLSSIANMVPTGAFPSMIGCMILLTIAAVVFYLFTKNTTLAVGLEVIGIVVMAVVYLVNADLYESCMTNLLNALSLTNVYYTFADDRIFDAAGLVKIISAAAVCLFLTDQVVQKRRWS